METDFTIITKNPEETVAFGRTLSEKLKDKDIIALFGDLGSGKTQVVKGICSGLGVKETVNSPTFIIVNEYSSDKIKNIFHFDLYRMKTEDEIINIGFDDYMNSRGIILIEWPEHIERLLPGGTVKIHLAHSVEDENHRYIRVESPSH